MGHLVFVWKTSGYELREHEGDAPQLGAELEYDGARMRVAKVALSPLPGDTRPCAYLVAA